MKNLTQIILVFMATFLQSFAAENLTQTIRGSVIDADTRQPIIGATVVLIGSNPFKGTTTDLNGNFILTEVPVGRADIQISFIGYEPQTFANLVVTSAKEVILNAQLTEKVTRLNTVEITATSNKGDVRDEMATVSARSFTVDETGRFAGSFNDPARMVSSYAGVSSDPSGNNEIIVRGNSPRGILWRLEGVEIPNPNHFSNQGSTGGPISILNSNVLDNSAFYSGAFPAEFGNAYSGVFDISLRKGNNRENEYSFGIGALGIDATAEGALGKNNGSYLANYRYSSLGLLDKANIIDFDGVPVYQDAAFNLHFPLKKGGSINLFGIGGMSQIDQSYYNEGGDTLMTKGIFGANMGVFGINHFMLTGEKSYLKNSISVNGNQTLIEYESRDIGDKSDFIVLDDAHYTNLSVRASTKYHYKLNSKNKLQAGGIFSTIGYKYDANFYNNAKKQLVNELSDTGLASYLQTYAALKHRFTDNLEVNIGVHYMYILFNQTQSVEPRLGVKWAFAPGQWFTFGAGMHSRMEALSTYYTVVTDSVGNRTQPNKNLKMPKALHQVIGYEWQPNKISRLKFEAYYQYLFDVPTAVNNNYFSTLNMFDGYFDQALQNKGYGRNYGIEITAERFLSNGFYGLVTTSIFQSEYKTQKNVWYNTQFNNNFVVNVLAGKEFTLADNGKTTRIIGVNGKLFYSGAIPHHKPLLNKSIQSGYTEFDITNPYADKTDNIFGLNLAAYYRLDKKKTSHEFKIDIQNITNNQARLMPYYNPYKKDFDYQTQMAFLPNVSYKIFF